MFPSSVIRKLALSEEMLAETHNFVGLSAHLEGPIDVDKLSEAFDLLLEAHPVLTARLERGKDGRHDLVSDDLLLRYAYRPGALVRSGRDAHYANSKAGVDLVTKERTLTFTHGTETLQCFLYSDALPGDAPHKTN